MNKKVMKKVDIIIQARTGSTRLPGKVLFKLFNKTILEHVVDRLKQVKSKSEIIISTTILPGDDKIIRICERNQIKCYRGNEFDVLDRYYHTALENKSEIIVRVTSDCPLVDPELTEQIISFFLNNDYNLVTNSGLDEKNRTFPRGLDVEVFDFEDLEKAYKYGKKDYEREHVTPYFYLNQEKFKIFYYKNKKDYSHYRWTLDTSEDFKLIKIIYERLYRKDPLFSWKDILELFNAKPDLININKDVKQKKIGE